MISRLKIKFNNINTVEIGDILDINIDVGTSNIFLRETFVTDRFRSNQVTIPTTGDIAEQTASNFVTSFNLDYSNTGGTGNLIASIDSLDSNTVNIDVLNNTWQFIIPTGSVFVGGKAIFSVENEPVFTPKTVTIDGYSANTLDRCGNVDVSLLVTGGSGTYNVYVDDVLTNISELSPITATVSRGNPHTLRVTDSLNELIGTVQTINTRKLVSTDISVTLLNLTGGTTVTVDVGFISADISVYEYSLNNVDFQTSNVFTGQVPGNKTIYVKDGFGCVTSKTFVVDGVTTIPQTVFEISNINPLRFAKVDNEKKNQKNTLSYNELRLNTYPYYQKFLNKDSIVTQFKTNAQYISAFKIFPDHTTSTLTVLKKTSNIGKQIKTTCTYFNLGNGKSGIYFGIVDELDYLTDAFLQELNYGGALPEWSSRKGQLITIEDIGQVAIDGTTYSEDKNSFVVELNIAYTGADDERIISAVYNSQPYEIYEFTTIVNNDDFQVAIQVGTDSENIDFGYLSEKIKRVEDNKFLFEIDYWDDENKGGFNYQTGVQNKLRIFGYQDDIGEQETEGYNGDKEYYVTDNVIYDVQKFTFDRLSTQMANKLRLVFSHKYVKVNGLFYKLADVPEISGDGNYNIKKFSVLLKQSGEQFLTTEQEVIIDSTEQQQLGIGLAEGLGKAPLLWTKNL